MRRISVLSTVMSLVVALALSVWPTTGARAAPEAGENVITVENRRPGTTRWQIPWSGKSVADDVSQQVKGYATATSVRQGQPIDLHVSTRPASTFTWHVYRLGWYGGQGGRLVVSGSATGVTQPTCPRNTTTGTIECRWSRSVSVPTSTSWTSGLYVVVLTAGAYQNYVPVTVRDDRKADILVLQPTNTYQAYNNYPDDRTTGKTLYAYNSYGAQTVGG
jgi:hypothetical protein